MNLPFRYSDRSQAVANRLCEWLDATTQYPDLKENLDRSHTNYDDPPKWRQFYYHGPVVVPNEGGILDSDGKATGFKIKLTSVCYDQEAQPGTIIVSRGRKSNRSVATSYMVKPNGSIKRI